MRKERTEMESNLVYCAALKETFEEGTTEEGTAEEKVLDIAVSALQTALELTDILGVWQRTFKTVGDLKQSIWGALETLPVDLPYLADELGRLMDELIAKTQALNKPMETDENIEEDKPVNLFEMWRHIRVPTKLDLGLTEWCPSCGTPLKLLNEKLLRSWEPTEEVVGYYPCERCGIVLRLIKIAEHLSVGEYLQYWDKWSKKQAQAKKTLERR